MIIYDLAESDYHNQLEPHYGIHKLIEFREIGALRWHHKYITGEIVDTRKRGVYDMGSAAHAYNLEGEKAYDAATRIKPSMYNKIDKMTKKLAKELGYTDKTITHDDIEYTMQDDGFYYGLIEKPWNGNATQCEQWLEDHKEFYLLDEAEDHAIRGMNTALYKYDESKKLLNCGAPEVTIRTMLETSAGKLPVQIRLDFITTDESGRDPMHWMELNDYKTCETLKKFKNDVGKLHYYVQKRFYERVVLKETGLEIPWNFIAQEKKFPYRIGVYEQHQEADEAADIFIDELLYDVAYALNNDEWPAGNEVGTVDIKPYLKNGED